MLAFAFTIFAGAFLLFEVQPLMGKYILPWFGGGPGVWTTCMLFFQVALLAGYAYAHFGTRWLNARKQALLHLALLVAALALLPITPGDAWKPKGDGNPMLQILVLLAASLGLPYFVLSATGPLLQQWFSRTHPGASPYRLYALSNVGSLLALVSYPFFFESHFTRKMQASIWAWGLAAYAVGCVLCAVRLWRSDETQVPSNERRPLSPATRQPSAVTRFLWLLLPACASALLLATTNKLCQDVASVPFLWVLPLALYLLTFIICFDSPRWYARLPFTLLLIAACTAICWALFQGTDLTLYKQVAIYAGGLFCCCMVCHGELYRLRPDPQHLTGFYLLIAAGGALGGVCVAVLAPVLLKDYYELNWALWTCGLLFVLICSTQGRLNRPGELPSSGAASSSAGRRPGNSNVPAQEKLTAREDGPGPGQPRRALLRLFSRWDEWHWLACLLPLGVFFGVDWFIAEFGREVPGLSRGYLIAIRAALWGLLVVLVGEWVLLKRYKTFQHWRLLACVWLWLGLAGLGVTLWMQMLKSGTEVVARSRNFYGVLTVYEYRKDEPKGHHFVLQHGRITHGLQFVDAQQAGWPTSYYGEESGIGLALKALPAGHRRLGLVGLGTGTLTAYALPGDYVRIYEINPDVKRYATSRFSYLANCAGKAEVALGDARLSMEQEPPQQFDLLALDAFSSDAIPVHLLTREAFQVYQRHLKTNGIIAVHISNHFLDLEPVVTNLARQFNYKLAVIDYDEADEEWWLYSSTWILLSRDEKFMTSPSIAAAALPTKTNAVKAPLWTDDFASLFQILK
ncbi:MAG TPA: fused MFS/spermidine synthase [Candidatus Binatia bacterium]|jgi:hypothetical protein|nr:fused MFS/spermidine synthase [Candidatus Binatia bacterium]